MGKRKVQKNQALFSSSGGTDETHGKKSDLKGKKTYSLQNSKHETDTKDGDEEELPKVRIPEKLESVLIDLILDEQKNRIPINDLSKRITSKKLMDVYNSLSHAGFSRSQVESAMTNVIMTGGDLIDALDWLCLNSQNDHLPQGFSETLLKEEEKLRPKFDRSLQVEEPSKFPNDKTEDMGQKLQEESPLSKTDKNPAMKDWILQYAQEDSHDEDDDDDNETDEEKEFNPTDRYSALFDELQDLKDQAAIAKSNNATVKHKELSKKLREMHLEMASLEKHPEFDKSIKAQLKAASSDRPKQKNPPAATETSNVEDDNEGFGLGLFAQAETPSQQPTSVTVREEIDVRSFEYTRSQWTGKSPKQFLIDWVRKHLPRSGPPKFKKIQVKVNRFKCTALVDRPKEEQLSVTPEILCENVKEAEHVSATLALYHLCRGQAVHQLLPPPYRNLWLEWLDSEKKEKDSEKEKENKPRDQFISKLMKSLKIEGATSPKNSDQVNSKGDLSANDDEDDEEDDWEALADKGQLSEIPTSVTQETKTSDQRKEESQEGGINSCLRKALAKRQATTQFQELLKTRQQLPVFQYRQKIASAISHHSVVVIAGETGSGKSTQVPQFILEDCINQGHANPHIICTQPRRISATSLALRVSQEMGEEAMKLSESMVGYQIRFESKRGPNTRLMYCTTGVVLRQLQASNNLDNVSHLVIDEVHERNVQSDFLMIVVKEILSRRSDLKVILMSATLDSEKFSSYFNHCPVINIPGRTYPVESLYIEDVIEMAGYVVDEDSPCTLNSKELIKEQTARVQVSQRGGNTSTQTLTWTEEDLSSIDWTDLPAEKYSLRTRNAVTRLNLNRINLDLICDLLRYLDSSAPYSDIGGAVLIFLPGLADIQDLYEMLTTDRQFSNKSKYQVFALHSVLSSKDQGRVFTVPPGGIRKIVLATNIAETGITIPDVVFVIDSGKAKEKRYMEATQMSTLDEIFISKANSKQRAGRAGRVQKGYCFKIFTCEQYNDFRAFSPPEMLRVPLEELCLNIMKCDYGKPAEFLAMALDPPAPNTVSRALSLLKEVGACHSDGSTLTPLGHHLSTLPVDVRIGKMLLLGAIFGCLEQVAVIAAATTDKSPFSVPLSKRSEADNAKHAMAIAQSDHITLYKAYKGWCTARQKGKGAEISFLNKNFLKKSTLQEIENVKDDLIKLIGTIGFCDKKTHNPGTSASNAEHHSFLPPSTSDEVLNISKVPSGHDDLDSSSVAMVKAVLTAGLYPQVGKILTSPSLVADENKVCMVETSQGTCQIHPASVNKYVTSTGAWLVYQEKVRLSRVYLRDTTVIQPYPLLLFGGAIDVLHTQQIVSVDGWMKFRAVAKTGVIFKELRNLLNKMLEKKLGDPSMDISRSHITKLLKDLIKSDKSFK